ncbi:MAG: cadherin-like domain-containing protein [Verrucomicrobiales bacterium]
MPSERVTFAVSMLGAGPFTYQWRLEGEPLDGATLPWLDLSPLEAANAGSYDVVVTYRTFAQATSLPAELTVIVPNAPPTFDGYAFSMQAGTSATIPLAALLAKADDIDGDPLSVASADSPSAEGGAVALGAGGVTYTPPVGFTGADSFSISVSDGGASVVGTVTVTVASQPIDPAAPSASIAVLPGGGSIETVFGGTPGQEYGFQRSLDLIDWDTLAAAVAGDDGILVFVDPAPPEGEGQVFYRTISPVPPTSNASVGSRSGKNAAPSR